MRRASAPQGNGQQEWQALQKEQDAFYKQTPPWWTHIKISKTPAGTRTSMNGGARTVNGGYYYFGTNQRLTDVYASLTGAERWQISQLPPGDERWDVRIRAKAVEKKNIPAAFLKEADMISREMAASLKGYKFTEGTPPANPTANSPAGLRRGGGIPQINLGSARGMIANRVNAPVEIQKNVADRKPAADAGAQFNWGLPPEKFADQVAAIFGVAVERSTVETTSVLIYNPKTAPAADVQRWLKDGKL